MCTRVRVYVCACMTEENRTHDQDRHTAGTQDTSGKGRTQAKRENLNIYVCLQAMKKSIKKVKKNLELIKKVVTLLLQSNQATL